MKILFDNYALTSTITATTEDANYPLTNLKHDFLKKIYKATDTTATITLDFGSAKTVDCVYLGYTNATAITITLYSATDVVLHTQSITPAYIGAVFTAVASCRKLAVAITAATNVYVGNIGVGNSYTMPGHSPKAVKEQIDQSNKTVSSGGQYRRNKIPWRKQIETEHFVYGIDDWNTMYALFADVETPVWVDVFEGTPGAILPFYADVTLGSISRDKDQYTFAVTSSEAF